ncbi:MAG: hypothetical protein ACPGWM_10185 [Flavobacteriales bacterium]
MKKLAFFTLLFISVSINAATIRVNLNPASAADYNDLQLAIDAAMPGDFIEVEGFYQTDLNNILNPGLTYEWAEVTIDKELHLVGVGYFLQANGMPDPNFDAVIVPKINFRKLFSYFFFHTFFGNPTFF